MVPNVIVRYLTIARRTDTVSRGRRHMTQDIAAAPETGGPLAKAARDPKWWTLTAVCLGVFMLLLDITIVNVALPDIQGQLDASLSDLQWVIDAYALSLAALLLTAGSLADLFGRRRGLLIGTGGVMGGPTAV